MATSLSERPGGDRVECTHAGVQSTRSAFRHPLPRRAACATKSRSHRRVGQPLRFVALAKAAMPEASVGALGGRAHSPLERIRLSWPVPTRIYLQYLLKFALYVAGWAAVLHVQRADRCRAPRGTSSRTRSRSSCSSACCSRGSGSAVRRARCPARAAHWFTPYRYFLTPGTIKLPFFAGLPIFGSTSALLVRRRAVRRQHRAAGARARRAARARPSSTCCRSWSSRADRAVRSHAVPVHAAGAVPLHGGCFLFPADWIAGAKWVQFAIWMGAGSPSSTTSSLTSRCRSRPRTRCSSRAPRSSAR